MAVSIINPAQLSVLSLSFSCVAVFPRNKLPAFIGLLTYRLPEGKEAGRLNKAFSIIRVCRRLWPEMAKQHLC